MKAALLLPVCLGWLAFASQAQVITNNGASIFVSGGAVLTVKGSFMNIVSGNAVPSVENNGTIQVSENWQLTSPALYSGTGTLELNGTSAQQISGTTVNSLLINNPSGVTQLENLTVTGNLTFTNGDLTATAGKSLKLEGSITENKNRIYEGALTKAMPVNPATVSQDFGNIGVTFENPDGGNWGEVIISRVTGALGAKANPNNPGMKGIKRHWEIEPQFTPAGKTIDLTLTWLTDENNGLTFPGNLAQVWKSEDKGVTWLPVGDMTPIILSADGNMQSVTVQTGSFSMWTVSDVANPLPVTWLSFDAKASKQGNELSWSTASEVNTASFTVERSYTGKDFTDIGQVAAAGNSTLVQKYVFLDKSALPGSGAVYYRLRQIDTDGKFEHSKIVALEKKGQPSGLRMSAFPNPFSGELTVSIDQLSGIAQIRLYDLRGKTYYLQQVEVREGRAVLDWLPDLAVGLYLLEVIIAGETEVVKVMKE
ncbi:T9SS type A sorting domain-containing protein [Rufibacter sp. LB8]|uniref:T9SS type A sorting domain-containing protein n=1 Tax=Rufibacter sp. LB8 TaxID=2777781 RepID=UPI00178C39C4|nr:T9SS type A sorting domain-containing protein [Rufibacter sp. LB8]